jgi:hypothetical protein
MSKPVWKSGPPPSLGWWPASLVEAGGSLRWWDDKCWSGVAFSGMTAVQASKRAGTRETPSRNAMIRWQPRPENWPARSRT